MGYKDLIAILQSGNISEAFKGASFKNRYQKAVLKYGDVRKQASPTDYYRPSSLSAGCERMLYFQRTQAKEDIKNPLDEWTTNLIGINDSGTHRHEAIQEIVSYIDGVKFLSKAEILEHLKLNNINSTLVRQDGAEFRFTNDELSISFQPDGIIELDGELHILEIKTMSMFAWNNLKNPVSRHILQASTYGLGLGIDKILFIYEDRNFTRIKTFIEDVTTKNKEKIKKIVSTTNQYIADKVVPPKEYEENKCKYCNYKELCSDIE